MLRKCLCGVCLPAILAWGGGVALPSERSGERAQAASAAADQPFAPVVLARPVEIRARLATGATFAGHLNGWDARTLRGTFGTRAWRELALPDTRRVFMQIMDRTNASQWLVLGELLAVAPEGRTWAEEAFRQAARTGATEEAITAARGRAATEATNRAERARLEAERRLRPGGASGGASTAAPSPTPWPALTSAEQTDAASECRRAFTQALEVAGQPSGVVETRFFLIGGDLPREELERIGREMDAACDGGRSLLGLSAEGTPFWGKPSLMACATEDSFAVAAAAVARERAAPGQRALLRTKGPRTDIIAWRGSDGTAFRTAVLREVGRAVLHRAHSPAVLPVWVEEGVADAVARGPGTTSPVDRERRPMALRYLRGGGQAQHVLNLNREAGDWPGPDGVGPAVAYLAVQYLLSHGTECFAKWVQAMKSGQACPDALVTAYGKSHVPLGASINGWYSTNDGEPLR